MSNLTERQWSLYLRANRSRFGRRVQQFMAAIRPGIDYPGISHLVILDEAYKWAVTNQKRPYSFIGRDDPRGKVESIATLRKRRRELKSHVS